MLPVTHGEAYTKLHILLYTMIMLLVSILPFLTVMSGIIYLARGAGSGGRASFSGRLFYCVTAAPHAAIKTFKYSITYLMLLFVVLLIDHYAFYMWL